MNVRALGGKRRYLMVLLVLAVAILVLGIRLRPRDAPPAPVSESQALNLQMQAQLRALESRSLFFSTKARELLTLAEQVRLRPEPVASKRPEAGDRLIIIAPVSGTDPLWMDVTVAGVVPARCRDAAVEEVVIASVLPAQFGGGSAWTLDNRFAGVVHDCGARNLLLSPGSYLRQLRNLVTERLYDAYGLKVRIDPATGARVMELRTSSELSGAGLRTGDVITQINSVQVTSVDQLNALLDPALPKINITREGKDVSLPSTAERRESGVRWVPLSRPARVMAVASASPAANWGLRAGDTVLQAGTRPSPSASAVDRLLTGRGDSYLVILRGTSEMLLERPE
jgi:hypothetical protein